MWIKMQHFSLSVTVFKILVLFSSLTLCTDAGDSATPNIIKLEKLNVNHEQITVSGFSAGASMATQFHIAHSSLFSGIAMFSQVFYYCGPRNILEFGIFCSMYGRQIFPYDVSKSIRDARKFENSRKIDSLDNLRNDKVFVWIGQDDEYVPVELAKKNKEFYGTFLKDPASQISLTVAPKTKHLFPTVSFGDSCDKDASKNVYLGSCGYSGAYQSLQFLLGNSTVQMADCVFDPASLHLFNQSEFYTDGSDIKEAAMGKSAFIYIPQKCYNSSTKCLLHFNFHGCEEWDIPVARRYIENNGFLPLAETNGIIVVFPLTDKVTGNMGGCWDFYSYTNRDFATKQGKQIRVVYNTLQRILYGDKQSLVIV